MQASQTQNNSIVEYYTQYKEVTENYCFIRILPISRITTIQLNNKLKLNLKQRQKRTIRTQVCRILSQILFQKEAFKEQGKDYSNTKIIQKCFKTLLSGEFKGKNQLQKIKNEQYKKEFLQRLNKWTKGKKNNQSKQRIFYALFYYDQLRLKATTAISFYQLVAKLIKTQEQQIDRICQCLYECQCYECKDCFCLKIQIFDKIFIKIYKKLVLCLLEIEQNHQKFQDQLIEIYNTFYSQICRKYKKTNYNFQTFVQNFGQFCQEQLQKIKKLMQQQKQKKKNVKKLLNLRNDPASTEIGI